eukprot:TRINITY_DN93605_c0_g1_i1.p1 TRINITY_DN93605_c0_g1~~TRINITY_DN93605_c0_g1_i1.p1  ORF type:complete len:620 (+),score=135.12 TRINITY_DN93605_c0_g1_i1:105-1964(+)
MLPNQFNQFSSYADLAQAHAQVNMAAMAQAVQLHQAQAAGLLGGQAVRAPAAPQGTMLTGQYNGSGWKGHNLYWLKNQRPELFTSKAKNEAEDSGPKLTVPGFKDFCKGWLHNAQTEEFIEIETLRRFALDKETGEYCLAHDGQNWESELSLMADATTSSGTKSAPPSKKLFIADLHRAASVMKLDLSHHDHPAAVFAVFDAGSSEVVDTAAKGFHMQLLPKLEDFRGQWSPERLKATLTAALHKSISTCKDQTVSVAAALLLGKRLIVSVAGPGARCVVSAPRSAVAGSSVLAVHSAEGSCQKSHLPPDIVRGPEPVAQAEPEASVAKLQLPAAGASAASSAGAASKSSVPAAFRTGLPPALPPALARACLQANGHKFVEVKSAVQPAGPVGQGQPLQQESPFGIRCCCFDLDVAGQFQSLTLIARSSSSLAAFSDEAIDPVAARLASQHRPRAGSRELVSAVRSAGIEGRIIIAMVNFVWAPAADSAPAAKRARTEAQDKVRVRHILLRYAGCAAPTDPVRHKKATRSLEEAEDRMLSVLSELDKEPSLFTAKCRSLSECQSSLKGGELAGDLGWLSRDKPSSSMPEVHKAAFNLAVGQLSDLVLSKNGIHVLMRTA